MTPPPELLIRPVDLPRPRGSDVWRRLAQAAWSSTRHLAQIGGSAARRKPVDARVIANAVRAVFDDLGGTFSKFGQLIGSAPSLFGDDVAASFRSTLDGVAPIPFPQVRATVEEALGLPMSRLFASFDEQPIAAASVAAVHRAVLLDGRTVAVKVLRPDVEYAMAVDLAVMQPLFDFLGHQIAIGVLGELPALISGLAEQLSEELDLRNEARSMRWFDHLCGSLDLERVVVPTPIDGFVTRRVLAMTYIDGVSVDAVAEIEAMGIDPAPLVQDCVRAWFASALTTGAFHGDVHAGNLLITPDSKLAILDWGIVGRFDDHTKRFFRRMIEGVLGDETAWADVWTEMEIAYGPVMQENLGLTDEQMVQLIRMQIEPLFLRPFGEVKLSDLITNTNTTREMVGANGPNDAKKSWYAMWQAEREFRRGQRDSGSRDTGFDRGTFLLGKQLVYFERYGKLFMPESPLMWDPSVFRRLLDETATQAPIQTPTDEAIPA